MNSEEIKIRAMLESQDKNNITLGIELLSVLPPLSDEFISYLIGYAWFAQSYLKEKQEGIALSLRLQKQIKQLVDEEWLGFIKEDLEVNPYQWWWFIQSSDWEYYMFEFPIFDETFDFFELFEFISQLLTFPRLHSSSFAQWGFWLTKNWYHCNLEFGIFSYNKITNEELERIWPALALYKPKTLDLSAHNLTTLPECVAQLKELREVHLENNPIPHTMQAPLQERYSHLNLYF